MAVKRLVCRCLAARRRIVTVGLALTLFTFFGTWMNSPRVLCWSATLGEDAKTPGGGDDPYPLIEEAHRLLSQLLPSTASNLRRVGGEFDLERNLRIQEALFREDLLWLNRGYSPKQMDLMVFVAVALSLENAGEVESELRDSLEADLDPKVMRRLKAVDFYRAQAVQLLQRLSRELDSIPKGEFAFHY